MSNLNLNKVILAGRLIADPELKQTQSGISVLSTTIAINRKYAGKVDGGEKKQETDFINLVAWRQTADFISKFFKKGSAICVSGSIQSRTWSDKDGNKRYATEVIVDEAMFVDSKGEQQQGASYTPEAYKPQFEEVDENSDLPF